MPRKPIKTSPKKDEVFFFRLSPAMSRRMRERAAANERSISEEIRQAILAALRQEVA